MKIFLINPAPKHYTRARCSPLGVLSIASYLNANGHTAKVLNRAITSTDIAAELDEFRPDFIGCSLLTVMAVSDSIAVSEEAKKISPMIKSKRLLNTVMMQVLYPLPIS